MREMRPLGSVIQGSLSQGLEVRLHPDVLVEEMRVGKFLVVQGVRSRFFCMLTDVALGMASQRILASPPEPSNVFLQEVLAGSGTYGTVDLTPMLMFTPTDEGQTEGQIDSRIDDPADAGAPLQLLPVKTIPGHFSQVYDASERDFRAVFGWEDDLHRRNFAIGEPIDMAVPICIDLDRFVERSNGIFGKSGTGKSFLTRLILSGIIRKQAAVNLIFDMHSEYGWEAVSEGKEFSTVKGLRQLFPAQVQIFTLDAESTKRRGVYDAQELYISFDQIDVEDLMLISRELNLSEASLENAIICATNLAVVGSTGCCSSTMRKFKSFVRLRWALNRPLWRYSASSPAWQNSSTFAVAALTTMSAKSSRPLMLEST